MGFSKFAALAAVVGGGLIAGNASAAIVNGGFETGDLTGWTSTANVSAVNSAASLGWVGNDPAVWNPTEGQYFGYLTTGLGEGIYTIASQAFSVVANDILTLDVFFDAGDELPLDDNGFVKLLDMNTFTFTTLYSESVGSVGDYSSDGWTSLSHTFASGGTYQIIIGVENIGDNFFTSAVGVDDVAINAVPVPAAIWLFGSALAGMGTIGGWRRRASVA